MPQPRYSLLVWSVLFAEAHVNGAVRPLRLLTAAYLSVGFALMTVARGGVRGDLNALPVAACQPLLSDAPVDLVLAPYPRTRAQWLATRRPRAPVLTIPSIRHQPEIGEQLAQLRFALIAASKGSA